MNTYALLLKSMNKTNSLWMEEKKYPGESHIKTKNGTLLQMHVFDVVNDAHRLSFIYFFALLCFCISISMLRFLFVHCFFLFVWCVNITRIIIHQMEILLPLLSSSLNWYTIWTLVRLKLYLKGKKITFPMCCRFEICFPLFRIVLSSTRKKAKTLDDGNMTSIRNQGEMVVISLCSWKKYKNLRQTRI